MNEHEHNARRSVHEAIQFTNDSNENLEDSILVGWACVCEWSDPQGSRWLSRLSGSAGGEDSPPTWQSRGYLHEALTNWDEFDD